MDQFAAPVTGTLVENRKCCGKRWERGIDHTYHLYWPPENGSDDAALYVLLEHEPKVMVPMLEQFMLEELIPRGMVLFVYPGTMTPTLAGGEKRNMRAAEFDQYGTEFANFLIDELIPDACKSVGVSIDVNPDMHFITGGSSGGMAAWNALWFRNDYFRRGFLSSPTLSAMRGGEEAMVLVRKCEARPIRVYITSGTEEPDYYFGSSLMAARNAASALEFAGYDFRYEEFPGGGHCCHREDENLWRRMCAFIWGRWRTVPVAPLGEQIRIRKLVEANSVWTPCVPPEPKEKSVHTPYGDYSFEGDTIYLTNGGKKTVVADGFGEITAIGLSADLWRLYIADQDHRFIYAMNIHVDGRLDELKILAPLHLAHDCRVIGAKDLVVLPDDRVLAATELGVQGIVSFGITDLILPLPDDLAVTALQVEGNTLYAAAGEDWFRRQLRGNCKSQGYGDGFDYTRSHLMP